MMMGRFMKAVSGKGWQNAEELCSLKKTALFIKVKLK